MKKIIVVILIAMASCKEKAEDKTPDQIVNEAAMPCIAKEIGELDFNVMNARDTTRSPIYRNIVIDKIRSSGPEYLYSTTIENIFSRDFEERLESQKKLIVANWRQIERNKQYEQIVIESFKK